MGIIKWELCFDCFAEGCVCGGVPRGCTRVELVGDKWMKVLDDLAILEGQCWTCSVYVCFGPVETTGRTVVADADDF